MEAADQKGTFHLNIFFILCFPFCLHWSFKLNQESLTNETLEEKLIEASVT